MELFDVSESVIENIYSSSHIVNLVAAVMID